ncbi:hypothetical protein Q2374_27965 [Escherichia coli]|nr:hypothetical protein [Escherichia coli]
MQPFAIAPSILSAAFVRLGEVQLTALVAVADIVHFDVMDNHHVPEQHIASTISSALR